MLDAVGMGALNLDRLTYQAGKTRVCEHECPGGSAANTIAWLADAGYKTGIIGAVGNDREGRIILEDFHKRNVDTTQIQTIKGHSGLATGFVDSKGERVLRHQSGVNDRLTLSLKSIEYAFNARLLHLTSFVSDRQLRLQEKLATRLPAEVKLSFSPGEIYAAKGLDRLKTLLERSRIVFLNQEEIEQLTGVGYKKSCIKLTKIGVKQTAVTLGPKGCYIHANGNGTKIPCRKLKPKDTTGAGDSFAAGYLAGLLEGKTPEECGRLGNQYAGKCIRHRGARKPAGSITSL